MKLVFAATAGAAERAVSNAPRHAETVEGRSGRRLATLHDLMREG